MSSYTEVASAINTKPVFLSAMSERLRLLHKYSSCERYLPPGVLSPFSPPQTRTTRVTVSPNNNKAFYVPQNQRQRSDKCALNSAIKIWNNLDQNVIDLPFNLFKFYVNQNINNFEIIGNLPYKSL